MRTISTTLQTAQAANVQRPYVALESRAQYCNRALLNRSVIAESSGAYPDAGFRVALTDTNNLLLRFTNTGTIKLARGSNAWATLITGVASTIFGVAQSGVNLWLYFFNAGRTAIQQMTSTNNGASWSSATTIYTLPSGLGVALAAVYGVNQRVIVATNTDIRLVYFNGTSWAAQTTNAPTGFSTCEGLAVEVQGATLRVVASLAWLNADGSYSNKVLSYTLNDGATPTWNSGYEGLLFEGNSATIRYLYPSLLRWNGTLYVAVYWQIAGYSGGTIRVTLHRLGSVVANNWQSSLALVHSVYSYNLALTVQNGQLILFEHFITALTTNTTPQSHAVADCTLRYDLDSDTLDATVYDGAISNELVLTLGYNNEGVQHIFWRESAFSQPNGSTTIRAYGVLELLKRETTLSDRVFVNNAGVPLNVSEILRLVLGSLNIDTSAVNGASFTTLTPTGGWAAGESVYDLVGRLLMFCGAWGCYFRYEAGQIKLIVFALGDNDYFPTLATLDAEALGINAQPTAILSYAGGNVSYAGGGNPEQLVQTSSSLALDAHNLLQRSRFATDSIVRVLRPQMDIELGDSLNPDALEKINRIVTRYSARGEWVQEVGVGSE